MSKVYAVEVTRIYQETFYIETDSSERAEKYAMNELASEVDELVETTTEVSFEMDTADEIPEVGAKVIKVA